MQVINVATLTWWSVSERVWDSKDPVGSYIHGNVWVESSDIGASDVQERLAGLNASLCRRLGDYEYWWDEQRRFRNIACMFPCTSGQTEHCVGLPESFMAPSQGEVFIPTHRTVTPHGHEWQGHTAQESFMLSAEALTIGLTYHYDMPKYTWDGHLRDLREPAASGARDKASSTQDITTLLVRADGTTRELPPGRGLRFTGAAGALRQQARAGRAARHGRREPSSRLRRGAAPRPALGPGARGVDRVPRLLGAAARGGEDVLPGGAPDSEGLDLHSDRGRGAAGGPRLPRHPRVRQ
eukprot:CAMPEP_0179191828 /NCGR_PEP_ID=MMETSP0796-20121207/95287_1 /TAXON_ID=73915 /ORGANISM="Pyrodinium bahamense, Strain pbaha01" /LENGTH=295 /DNA_ID=CAMNT_0020896063 /DNA_START=68 /DNA_END=952 /DNA_ORIENTATION=-